VPGMSPGASQSVCFCTSAPDWRGEAMNATQQPRSKAWAYYSVLAGLSFIAVCTGHLVGPAGLALFGLYARYLWRPGGHLVLVGAGASERKELTTA
jgi:hypothetical protein